MKRQFFFSFFCATMWIFHEPIFVWINCECRRRKCCWIFIIILFLFHNFCWWMEIFTWSTLDCRQNFFLFSVPRCNVYKDVFEQSDTENGMCMFYYFFCFEIKGWFQGLFILFFYVLRTSNFNIESLVARELLFSGDT